MDDLSNLIEPHVPALRRYAWSLAGDRDAADDLVQDCLERAISRWPSRHRDGNLRVWLFTILRNLFLSAARQRTRRGPHLPLDALVDGPTVAGGQDDRMRMRDLMAGLDTLPEEQRSVLLLVSIEDLSYEETAKVLGVPIGTVMSRLSRARDRLRVHMESGPAPSERKAPDLRRVK
ncbi:MAG: RNA polymerase sigma factor [Rhodospirillum sp.]|nr:RNA polymerase sigma factor [Rhodospirillum sp.]MCF8490733.1 RNA polymerase sigma factor [Rhodospirillum sp.]MCF8501911.1 RNA polymerase sigma factor [Rhodospirillum sp.]